MPAIFVEARRHVRMRDKINPLWLLFGNADDPDPPDSHAPGRLMWWRRITWWVRNPAHNFTFYLLGVGDRDRTLRGLYGTDVHPPQGGWLICWTTMEPDARLDLPLQLISFLIGLVMVLMGASASQAILLPLCVMLQITVPLPFVSYLGKRIKGYIGWRPAGAFGIKLNFMSQK